MEQIIIQLSFLSLTTSISNSFHPNRDSSIKTSLVGERSRPFSIIFKYSSSVNAIPPPDPPRVNEGLIIAGSPIDFKLFFASSIDLQIIDFAHSRPMSVIFFLNFSLSSAFSMASELAPINSILYFSKIPSFLSAIAALSAV